MKSLSANNSQPASKRKNYRVEAARRAAQKKVPVKKKETLSGHFWNFVGGALISLMLAGMIYVLNAMISSNLYGSEAGWDVQNFKSIFMAVFVVYVFMPRLLANIVGILFGSKSKSSGQRRIV